MKGAMKEIKIAILILNLSDLESAIVNFLQTFYMNFAHMLAFTGVHAVSSEDDVAKVCKSFSILNDEFFRSDSMIINSSINR